MNVSYLLTFVEGILSFLSPCILPMLPVYFMYLAGVTEKEASAASSVKGKMVSNSIGFVVGFTVVFVALGATASTIGHFLAVNKGLLQKISGVVIIILGLNFLGLLNIKFLNTEKRFDIKLDNLGFFRSILFGVVFAFGWTPCLGAFLGSALMLASNSVTIYQGMLMLLLFSIGLGLPFILTSLLFEKLELAFNKIKKHGRIIGIISGVVLIAAGILIFMDILKYLSW
jgi:cytochrome c-type biogenesis protein